MSSPTLPPQGEIVCRLAYFTCTLPLSLKRVFCVQLAYTITSRLLGEFYTHTSQGNSMSTKTGSLTGTKVQGLQSNTPQEGIGDVSRQDLKSGPFSTEPIGRSTISTPIIKVLRHSFICPDGFWRDKSGGSK